MIGVCVSRRQGNSAHARVRNTTETCVCVWNINVEISDIYTDMSSK